MFSSFVVVFVVSWQPILQELETALSEKAAMEKRCKKAAADCFGMAGCHTVPFAHLFFGLLDLFFCLLEHQLFQYVFPCFPQATCRLKSNSWEFGSTRVAQALILTESERTRKTWIFRSNHPFYPSPVRLSVWPRKSSVFAAAWRRPDG